MLDSLEFRLLAIRNMLRFQYLNFIIIAFAVRLSYLLFSCLLFCWCRAKLFLLVYWLQKFTRKGVFCSQSHVAWILNSARHLRSLIHLGIAEEKSVVSVVRPRCHEVFGRRKRRVESFVAIWPVCIGVWLLHLRRDSLVQKGELRLHTGCQKQLSVIHAHGFELFMVLKRLDHLQMSTSLVRSVPFMGAIPCLEFLFHSSTISLVSRNKCLTL